VRPAKAAPQTAPALKKTPLRAVAVTPVRVAPVAKAALKAASGAKVVSKAPVAAVKADCSHHWVIEPPNGAVSAGTCRMCGERREFRNSYEYSSWYGSKTTPKPGA
jgi:hypothetical protein